MINSSAAIEYRIITRSFVGWVILRSIHTDMLTRTHTCVVPINYVNKLYTVTAKRSIMLVILRVISIFGYISTTNRAENIFMLLLLKFKE